MTQLICVPPEMTKDIWPFVSGLIYVAMKKGGLSAFAPIQESVLEGRSLLWIAWGGDDRKVEAAAITSIAATEWRKVCEVVACAGKGMERWISLLSQIEDYAKTEGCSAMRIIGRRGWIDQLPAYHLKRVVLEKVL